MAILRADGVGKAYQLYKRPFDSLKELLLRRSYSETFWALRDVSLEIQRGGSLGIVGDNGAGKSTLLKLLAGALAPSTGRIERSGRVAAMLNLGAGFHPDLSGTENIRIGCAVLGLSPAETEAARPAIVAFSELGEFIERPVRTYSSGMQLRLGFSVATAVSPDLLVVDEHLSVGDQHFQHKCLRRITELRSAGCALVLCSHDLYAVRTVCGWTLWLRDGRLHMMGQTEEVIKAYEAYIRLRDADVSDTIPPAQSTDRREHPAENFLGDVTLGGGQQNGQFETGDRLELHIRAQMTDAAYRDGVEVAVQIIRSDAVPCYGVTTKMDGLREGLHALGDGHYGVGFEIESLPLLAGEYTFTVALLDHRSPHTYDYVMAACPFTVRQNARDTGVMRIAHKWTAPY